MQQDAENNTLILIFVNRNLLARRAGDGPESADAVACAITQTPVRQGTRTSISGAINFALPLFDQNPYRGLRRVIDISSGGENNEEGPDRCA